MTWQLDKIWTKYTRKLGRCTIPRFDEKRVLLICKVHRIATFSKP